MRNWLASTMALFSVSSHCCVAPPISHVIRRSETSATNSCDMYGTLSVTAPRGNPCARRLISLPTPASSEAATRPHILGDLLDHPAGENDATDYGEEDRDAMDGREHDRSLR